MINLKLKKKLVARMMGVGVDRVWFDPEHLDELSDIDTREDIRILIRKGYIKILPIEGQQRKEPRKRRGPGSRKGKKTARMPKKRLWIMRVRAQRKFIRMLRDKGRITPKEYRKLYMLIKGGMFRSKAHLKAYIREKLRV